MRAISTTPRISWQNPPDARFPRTGIATNVNFRAIIAKPEGLRRNSTGDFIPVRAPKRRVRPSKQSQPQACAERSRSIQKEAK